MLSGAGRRKRRRSADLLGGREGDWSIAAEFGGHRGDPGVRVVLGRRSDVSSAAGATIPVTELAREDETTAELTRRRRRGKPNLMAGKAGEEEN